MRNKQFWALTVVLMTAWALYELYPPRGRDIQVEFQNLAVKRDADYTNIIQRLQALNQQHPDRKFGNLVDAIATNNIERYFPMFPEAKPEKDPSRYIVNKLQRRTAGRIKLGLDLQGGVSFLVEMDTSALASAETNAILADQKKEHALSQAVEVLRKRVDKFGVAEPLIQPAGSDRILIQLPGLSDADMEVAKRQIQKAAFLEFRLVHPRSAELLAAGTQEGGYVVMKEERKNPDGSKKITPYLVKKKAERGLTGKYLTRAFVTRNQMSNEPVINFELNSEGGKLFGEITEQNVGNQLAIILDGVLYSAPVIQSPIMGGSGVITGDFDLQGALELAYVLQNPLEAPVKIIQSEEVDPSLGADTIRSAITAAIIGVIAVAGFMLVYYLFAGVVANVALILNIIILLGVMCYIHTTLTLPGIAGIVLTIGMAVDANVLIFERIREERAAGKSMRGALVAGYSKAFSTIFDSNLTTLISSVILIFMGTGPVKGFGVALTIGVSVSMFTALVVTRLIFDWMLDRNLLKSLPMLHLIRAAKIDFMRWAMAAFIASWSLILIGNSYGIFIRGHKVLGPDFAGGVEQIYKFAAPTGGTSRDTIREDVRRVLAPLNLGEVTPGIQQDVLTGSKTLRLVLPFKEGISESVAQTLTNSLPQYQFSNPSVASVGPTVGKEITQTAVVAAMLAMFGILVYVAFRYEFSFAVGAVIAIVHDILMTMGWFFLSGRELSAPIVAAVLTIIGFSINDTIVIFDRIREDLKLGIRGTFREVMNKALNQTLSRTIITSGTVFLATLSLYLFGGGVVNDFAFTFLVGILTGTYSSIYIASAIVLWWHKGQRPTLGSGAQTAAISTSASASAPAPARS